MRKALSLIAKAAVSGLLLYFTLAAVDVGAVMARLSQIDLRWVGIGLLILLAQNIVLSSRWRQIVARCGADLSLPLAFRFTMIGAFFNQTLPSSVGGDAVRIWLLGKQTNWRIAGYSVFLDRVVGVVALSALVVGCLPWTLALIHDPVGRAALLVIGLGFILAGFVFVGLSWQRLQILQRWAPTRHLAAVAGVAVAILRSPRSLAVIFGLSIVIHLMTALVGWCAAHAIGANMPLSYSLFLIPPVILVTVLPISIAGWGLREGAMVAAFDYAGLPQADGLIVSLLFGAGFLVIGIIGGLVWILTVDRGARKAVPAAALDS
jgi:glycosyltransferase 2 family protein